MIIKKSFIFVRHGQTEANVLGLCQGKIDYPLTPEGRAQAESTGMKLKAYQPFKKIYSSDLGRAAETARIIASFLGNPEIEYIPDLQERGWGIYEGTKNTLMYEQESRELEKDYHDPSGVEGLEEQGDFLRRINSGMNTVLSRSEDSLPLVISHGRFFFYLCRLLGVPGVNQIPNGTPVLCTQSSDKWGIQILEPAL